MGLVECILVCLVNIVYRYEIVGALGCGTFGDVVRALDHKTKTHVAIKVIRNDKAYTQQAAIEVYFVLLMY